MTTRKGIIFASGAGTQRHPATLSITGRGYACLDTDTHDSLLETSMYIAKLENRQSLKAPCPKEICFRQGRIDAERTTLLAQALVKNGYGSYLRNLVKGRGC